MNRNVESHFALTPNIDIGRSTFDRSQDIKMSFNVGQLVPFFVDEVLPGDTFKIETSKVVRLQTLLTPVMDNIYLDCFFFFCPYRLVWQHFREFMGENTSSAWLPAVTYTIPQIQCGYYDDANSVTHDRRVKPGDFADYLGIPVNVPFAKHDSATDWSNDTRFSFSALPWRAYSLIWSEFFRDENLQDPVNLYTGDSDVTYYTSADGGSDKGDMPRGILGCYNVAKYHDYFTSGLPAPLKGDPVMAPVSSSNSLGVPVGGFSTMHQFGNHALIGKYKTSSQDAGTNVRLSGQSGFPTDLGAEYKTSSVSTSPAGFNVMNLYGDVSSLGINIMQLRNAFQVEKLLERDARSGTRYIELIKGHFNVTSPDARLQRPEYLGGNRVPISIHQITNQSQDGNNFLGDLGAMSLTTDRHSDFVHSFTEHGVILGLCCARYDHSYPQGLERMWSRKSRFDFYWPEFAHLSEQAILNKEIYAQGTSADDQVFAYQECWADYRYKPNRVAGEMRPGISNSLASWHFADYYQSQPYLSSAWIQEDKSMVDRTLAVTSSNANQVFCDIYVKNITTRPMPVYSVPGLADHF